METEEDAFEESESQSDLSKKGKIFHKTQFLCGDMSSIILVFRHIKAWVKKAKKQFDAYFLFFFGFN